MLCYVSCAWRPIRPPRPVLTPWMASVLSNATAVVVVVASGAWGVAGRWSEDARCRQLAFVSNNRLPSFFPLPTSGHSCFRFRSCEAAAYSNSREYLAFIQRQHSLSFEDGGGGLGDWGVIEMRALVKLPVKSGSCFEYDLK